MLVKKPINDIKLTPTMEIVIYKIIKIINLKYEV